jgi:hypothetical protein
MTSKQINYYRILTCKRLDTAVKNNNQQKIQKEQLMLDVLNDIYDTI